MPPIPLPEPQSTGLEIPVPLSSLAQPDDAEKLQSPQQGDVVNLQVEASVSRVEGDMAFLKPISINGKEIEEEAQEPTIDQQESELRSAMEA